MRTASADKQAAQQAAVAAALADRRTAQQAAITATLANLPSDLGRDRIFSTAASAAFWGVSVPHWRRMYRDGKVPRPIKIGERKLGWRLGTLIDGLKAREQPPSDA